MLQLTSCTARYLTARSSFPVTCLRWKHYNVRQKRYPFQTRNKEISVGKNTRFWEKQRSLLSELGVDVGNDWRDPDTIAKLDELHDEITTEHDIYTNQTLEMKDAIFIEEQKLRHKVKMKIIEKKHFKQPLEVNILTWAAKEQIRYLHHDNPDEWTVEHLMEYFPVSRDGCIKILKSKWRPRRQEEVDNHDTRVEKVWLQLKAGNKLEPGTPLADRYTALLSEGRLQLLEHAAGNRSLPAPDPIPLKSGYLPERRSLPGPWESVVKDYCELQENLQKKNPSLISKGRHAMQLPGLSTEDKQQKLLTEVSSGLQKESLEKKRKDKIQTFKLKPTTLKEKEVPEVPVKNIFKRVGLNQNEPNTIHAPKAKNEGFQPIASETKSSDWTSVIPDEDLKVKLWQKTGRKKSVEDLKVKLWQKTGRKKSVFYPNHPEVPFVNQEGKQEVSQPTASETKSGDWTSVIPDEDLKVKPWHKTGRKRSVFYPNHPEVPFLNQDAPHTQNTKTNQEGPQTNASETKSGDWTGFIPKEDLEKSPEFARRAPHSLRRKRAPPQHRVRLDTFSDDFHQSPFNTLDHDLEPTRSRELQPSSDTAISQGKAQSDAGMEGTQKIPSPGLPHAQLMKMVKRETDTLPPKFDTPRMERRQGTSAYGYFTGEAEVNKDNDEVDSLRKPKVEDGTAYIYDEQTGYQYPYGKQERELQPIKVEKATKRKVVDKEVLIKKGNAYYDECGSPQRVIGADTLSFNAKVDLVNF